jgi:hypothetical protein
LPIFLTWFLVIAGAIVTIDSLLRIGTLAYRRTIGKRKFARQKLSRLGANAHISYFISILGQPVFIMQHSEELTEHVFIDKLYYVQAIVAKSENVRFYTVTVRDKRLRCVVPLPNEGRYTLDAPSVKIGIGRDTFGTIGWEPTTVLASLGARRAWYAETYYLGNPMNYQTLILSWNDAGFGSWPPLEALLKDFSNVIDSTNTERYLRSDTTLRLRPAIQFNSYGFTAPHETPKDDQVYLGVDSDKVRVIP